ASGQPRSALAGRGWPECISRLRSVASVWAIESVGFERLYGAHSLVEGARKRRVVWVRCQRGAQIGKRGARGGQRIVRPRGLVVTGHFFRSTRGRHDWHDQCKLRRLLCNGCRQTSRGAIDEIPDADLTG